MIEPRIYTPGEKFANIFTHSIAIVMSIYWIFMLEANSKNAVQAISTGIYGSTLILMFISSVCYHSMTNEKHIRFFQKIDHSAIYMLIAGTYTPALMLTVKYPLNIVMLLIIWGLAITGIIIYCTTVKSKYLSTLLYLLMGWISIFFVYSVWTTSHSSVWLLLVGGVFYSLGCIFYLIKSLYTHFIWHVFVIAGAAMHYFAIMELLKAVN